MRFPGPVRHVRPLVRGACVAMLAGVLLLGAASVASASLPPIRHVFVLIDENERESTTFGPGSAAPYLSQTLVSQGAYLSHYYGIGHASLDNYIAMVSGQAPNPLTSGDCPTFQNFTSPALDPTGQETDQGCVYPANVPTLMSQLDAAGLTWRAYEDSMGADPTRESATCWPPDRRPGRPHRGRDAARSIRNPTRPVCVFPLRDRQLGRVQRGRRQPQPTAD